MTAFAGVRGTGDWGTDERPKNFREGILFLNPNGMAPIFGLSSKMGKKTVDDPEFSWWDEPNNLVRLQLSGALSASASTVGVDSNDPAEGSIDAHWGTASNLKAGDLLMVEPAADAANLNTEVVKVTSVTNATSFEVSRGAAGTTAAAITDNSYLLKIGSAYSEGTRAPDATSRNPIKYYNLTEIFKNTYELTGTVMQTRARTGDPMRNDKKRKMFDHSRDIETSILFGRRHETTGTNGKPERYMGGLRSFIPSSILSNDWSMANLLDNVSTVFDWDSMAGDERMVFCGNGALNEFNKKLESQSSSAVRINYDGRASMYGVNFRRYIVPQGELMIKTHPLLSRHPLYNYSWWIIDGSALKWVALRNRDTKFKDNIQHNDEDTTKGQWMTEGSIMVDRGGLTMKYIGGFNL